ncbi:MAG TPA: hypothetical protein DCZ94_16600 [Lentisphaeria bacterium]|nr:MAG: hypothetical protein A2X48_01605 [Lentisphaerae bacterium GWF2_49_21]HBC88569.1 hypothetical protein [Lentisphaeria bacterium]
MKYLAALLLFFLFAKMDAGENSAVQTISGDKLTVEIMDPNHPDRYNRGVRFTPVAAVLGVKMDGKEFMFHPEKHDVKNDHGGLASEFDLCIPGGPDEDLPPGYLEAKDGEGFLKIGVGVLKKKKGENYSLFQQPEVIDRAKTDVQWDKNGAKYEQTSRGVNGYGYKLNAYVRILDNRINVEWKLNNTGTKAFTTKNYVHNFFRFDDRNVGPDYVLSFPYDFNVKGLEAEQTQSGRDINFVKEIPKWVNMAVAYPQDYTGINTCVLKNTANGMSITCETSVTGFVTAIHGRPNYVSPEQFIKLSLKPGETASWNRTYIFVAGK